MASKRYFHAFNDDGAAPLQQDELSEAALGRWPTRVEKRSRRAVSPPSPSNTNVLSRSPSCSDSDPKVTGAPCQYEPSASILLLGFRGAGKHTLGLIASVRLRRQYVDFESVFEKHIGSTPHDYIQLHGLRLYREAESKIVGTIVDKYRENYVISGPTGLGCQMQKKMLRSFSTTNPVIYVRRDWNDLRGMLGNVTSESQIFRTCDSFYRCCSNLDFFNVTQPGVPAETTKSPTTLKLKQTEIDFMHFVDRVFGRIPKLLNSADPLTPSYTHVLEISLDWLESHKVDHEELDVGADVISLVVAEYQNSVESLRDRIPSQMARLRRATRSPLMIDVQYSSAQGEAEYYQMLKLCLRSGPEFMTVSLATDPSEINAIGNIRGSTQLVGTFHFEWNRTASSRRHRWLQLHDLALRCRCHAIRLTHQSTSLSENLEILHDSQEARKTWKLPLIAYSTGLAGRTSVCLNPVLSPVQLSGPFSSGLTLGQAQAALNSCFVLPKQKFTIFGKSVSYSLSPAFHNAAYAACGMPHSYGLLQSDDFEKVHTLFRDAECGGVTISLPFKSRVCAILDGVSPEASEIGAVNTVRVERQMLENGSQRTRLLGYNTDHIGIRVCIERNLSPANSIRDGSTALIIGAGGMARAALYSCHSLGIAHVCVYNRTIERAQELAAHYNQKGMDIRVLTNLDQLWPSDLRQPTVLVSCIPAHAIGGSRAHELSIPDQWLRSPSGGVFVEVRSIHFQRSLA
jgi:shikimate 5-dehydrogenase/shikimate kinase